MQLYSADDYGGREDLLRRADLLLDESGLLALVTRFEQRMESTLASSTESGPLPHEVFQISGALSLLAQTLRDPDIHVRAVLRYSPRPNELQKESFARAYLEAGRPADALAWLQEPWERIEQTRLALKADALGRLGRHDESAPIRQALFERSVSVFDLHRWLEHLPEASRPAALERARRMALEHDDPAAAATLLVEIGDDEAAEAMLLAESARIRGDDYAALVPLARAMQARERLRGETVVYRGAAHGDPRAGIHASVRTCCALLDATVRDRSGRSGAASAGITREVRGRSAHVQDPEHRDMLTRCDDRFDPDRFDIDRVNEIPRATKARRCSAGTDRQARRGLHPPSAAHVLPIVLLLPDALALHVLHGVQLHALASRDDAVGLRTILDALYALLAGIESASFAGSKRAGLSALVDAAILVCLPLVDAGRVRLGEGAGSGGCENDGYGESGEHHRLRGRGPLTISRGRHCGQMCRCKQCKQS
ncbi:MAG: hypothetical protein LT102_02530 [Burkholderiaceae bacterium]|nr:hypothetical protein [Burkholderiaceae bacterium]